MLVRTVFMCALCALILSVSGKAQAVVVFQDDFDDETAGTNTDPGTPIVGQDWQVTEKTASRVAVVDTQAQSGANSLLVRRLATDDSPSPLATASFDAASQLLVQNAEQATISFEMLLLDDGSTAQSIVLGNGPGGQMFNLHFIRSSSVAGEVQYFNGSFNSTGLNFAIGQWQTIQIDLDFDADTFTLSIEGNATTGSTDVGFTNNQTTFESVSFGSARPNHGYFDDVLITTVPEPASAVLLCAGVALMVRGRSHLFR